MHSNNRKKNSELNTFNEYSKFPEPISSLSSSIVTNNFPNSGSKIHHTY